MMVRMPSRGWWRAWAVAGGGGAARLRRRGSAWRRRVGASAAGRCRRCAATPPRGARQPCGARATTGVMDTRARLQRCTRRARASRRVSTSIFRPVQFLAVEVSLFFSGIRTRGSVRCPLRTHARRRRAPARCRGCAARLAPRSARVGARAAGRGMEEEEAPCGAALAMADADACAPDVGGAEDESRVVVATVIRPLLPHELAGAPPAARCCAWRRGAAVQSDSSLVAGCARVVAAPDAARPTARARPPDGCTECAFATPGEPQARPYRTHTPPRTHTRMRPAAHTSPSASALPFPPPSHPSR
jgi:hypothetical protein